MATDTRPLSTATSQDTLQVASNTPLPVDDSLDLAEPRPQYLSVHSPSPRNSSFRDSYGQSESGILLANKEPYGGSPLDQNGPSPPPKPRRRPLLIAIPALIVVALIAVAVIVPVYFKVIKPQNNTATSSSAGAPQPSSSSTKKPPSSASTVHGGDGSTIKASNGSTFTYNNKFGGMCEFYSMI